MNCFIIVFLFKKKIFHFPFIFFFNFSYYMEQQTTFLGFSSNYYLPDYIKQSKPSKKIVIFPNNHSKFSKPKTQNEKIEYFSFSFYHKYNLLIIWILCHIQTQKNIKGAEYSLFLKHWIYLHKLCKQYLINDFFTTYK